MNKVVLYKQYNGRPAIMYPVIEEKDEDGNPRPSEEVEMELQYIAEKDTPKGQPFWIVSSAILDEFKDTPLELLEFDPDQLPPPDGYGTQEEILDNPEMVFGRL